MPRRGPGRTTAVNAGMPDNAGRIADSWQVSAGRRPGRATTGLGDIVLTHCDIDDVGGVGEIKARTRSRRDPRVRRPGALRRATPARVDSQCSAIRAAAVSTGGCGPAPQGRQHDRWLAGHARAGHTAGAIPVLSDGGVLFSSDPCSATSTEASCLRPPLGARSCPGVGIRREGQGAAPQAAAHRARGLGVTRGTCVRQSSPSPGCLRPSRSSPTTCQRRAQISRRDERGLLGV